MKNSKKDPGRGPKRPPARAEAGPAGSRLIVIPIRVTEAERDRVNALAARLGLASRSDLVRAALEALEGAAPADAEAAARRARSDALVAQALELLRQAAGPGAGPGA